MTRSEADEKYKEKVREARDLIRKLGSAITKHEDMQKTRPGDWGFVGDMGHIIEQLKDLTKFMEAN